MNVTMHLPSFKITGIRVVLHRLDTGPVHEVYLTGTDVEVPFLVFRSLEDYDDWIAPFAVAKAEFGEEQALHAARPLVPVPERDTEPAWAAPASPLKRDHFAECTAQVTQTSGQCICDEIAARLPAPFAEVLPGIELAPPAGDNDISEEEFEQAKAYVIARHGALPAALQSVVDRGGRFGLPVRFSEEQPEVMPLTEPLPELPQRDPGQALDADADDQAQHDATEMLLKWGADPAETAALAAEPDMPEGASP